VIVLPIDLVGADVNETRYAGLAGGLQQRVQPCVHFCQPPNSCSRCVVGLLVRAWGCMGVCWEYCV
jgi:hypothetical protein